jgi:hypothetical protein
MNLLRRWPGRLITIAAAAYVGVVLVLFFAQRTLLYPGGSAPPDVGRAGLEGLVEPVHVTTADALPLLAWYRPPATERGAVIVYFHGNGGTIAHRGAAVRPLLEAGYGLLLLEYRGYGGNPGRPTEAGLYADARAALAFVDAAGIGVDRQVLYGESLGTGVAVQMATERGAAALVLASPYTSIADVAAQKFPLVPVRWLLLDRYESLAKIARLRIPLLVLHGERDMSIPARFGRALYEAAAEPKELVLFPAAEHNDLNRHGAPAAVLAFLRRHGLEP